MNSKKNKKKKKQEIKTVIEPVIIKKPFFSRAAKIVIAIVGLIASVLTIVVYWDTIKDWGKSKHDKFIDEKFADTGTIQTPTIIPIINGDTTNEKGLIFNTVPLNDSLPKINGIYIKDFDKKKQITFQIGTNKMGVNTKYFYEGISILQDARMGMLFFSNRSNGSNEKNPDVILGVKDNHLYVSAKFIDLKSEEIIGDMEFNHWKILKNVYNYKYNDKSIAVQDSQGHVVFFMEYNGD